MSQEHEPNPFLVAWKKVKDGGSDDGLWGNPELVSIFMAIMGRKGGRVSNPRKGFGSMTPERRREIAAKANATRWDKARRRRRS
jgi:hypothetical protein